MKHYLSDISDSQLMLLDGILSDNRKRKHSLRDIFNAIFYLLKTGCQWRMLPGCFPKWELVYYYFTTWKNFGIIEQIHELLRDTIRKKAGKNESQRVALIDSQFIKITRLGGENRGIDGGKMIKGRKHHILTYTLRIQLRKSKLKSVDYFDNQLKDGQLKNPSFHFADVNKEKTDAVNSSGNSELIDASNFFTNHTIDTIE